MKKPKPLPKRMRCCTCRYFNKRICPCRGPERTWIDIFTGLRVRQMVSGCEKWEKQP